MYITMPARTHLILFLRLIIAGTFILSAISKLLAPGLFEIILINQGVFSDRTIAAYFSRILIGFELAIGLLHLQPYYLKKIVSPITLMVLILFSIQLVYLMAAGNHENCGCFGELIKMSPWQTLMKNIFLCAVVIIMYRNIDSRNEKYFIPLLITVTAFAGTFSLAPIQQRENSSFADYTWFEGEGNVDLAQGGKLIAVFNVECEHCQSVATEIGMLEKEIPNFPKTYVLFFNEGDGSVELFNSLTGTHFPYRMIKTNEFFRLIGNSPPRIYVLRDGVIQQSLDDNIIAELKALFGRKP